MKMAVTGTGGFLGSRIVEYYGGRTFGEHGKVQILPLKHGEVSLTSEAELGAFWEREMPDLLIHCGAISDTGACQAEPERSFTVNVEVPKTLAGVCARYGTKLLFCSSDQIYFEEGAEFSPEHFHRENEPVKPKGVYGQQKFLAEQKILDACHEAVCLRLSWMYDWNRRPPEHGSLVSTIAENVRAGRTFSYPIYDFRSITNVWEVVRNLERAADLPGGVYNFGSRNEGSTYETAQQILKILSGEDGLLQKNEEAFHDCPRNLRMNTEKLGQYGIHFLSTPEGLLSGQIV